MAVVDPARHLLGDRARQREVEAGLLGGLGDQPRVLGGEREAEARIELVVDKGKDPELPGYSGFEATDLEETLRESGVDEVTVVGLATDYCVRATALEALERGFKVTVDPLAVAAVDVEPGDGERALAELREAGATVG